MAGGLTSAGFILPTLEDVEAELRTELLANVSNSLDLSAESPMGQIVTIFARQIVRAWEAIATAYGSCDPQKAEGILLDNVCALVGVIRLAAKYSTVPVNCTFSGAATIPANSKIANPATPSVVWVNDTAIVASGAGTVAGTFRAQTTGPTYAANGSLTQILTPVVGWTAVVNTADAVIGRNIETDTELRVRRAAELAEPGSSTLDAIRAGVLAVPGVIECQVYENTTDFTNSDLMPPHSIEVVVWDGDIPAADSRAIAQAIYDNKGGGTKAHGTSSVYTVTDASGSNVDIQFTRARALQVYLDLTIKKNKFWDAINGPAALKIALAAYGDYVCKVGTDVVALVIRAAPLAFQGVDDVPALALDFSPSPVATANLVVDSRYIARFDSANIALTVVS